MRPFPTIHLAYLWAIFFVLLVFHASATTYYVDVNSTNPTSPYTNWSIASTDIQSAVNQATNGDLVLVNPGTYQSGGYVAPDGTLSAVVVSNSVTVQSVNGASLTFINGMNAMRGIYLQNTSILAGFTITNGMAGTNSGGGIYCPSTSPIISNCVLTGNYGTGAGGTFGGMLYNCQIISNSAPNGDGGGALNSILINCVIAGNEAVDGGGVFQCPLTNCWVINNTASSDGGGSTAIGAAVTLENCLITGNSAQVGGGVWGSSSTIVNCTVAANSASSEGGGIYYVYGRNSIIYSNIAPSGPNWYDSPLISSSCNYCCTTPLLGGTGSITNDPLFVNAVGGDFHLQSNSLCINTGNNAYVATPTDLDGNPRIVDGIVDLGTYEYPIPLPLTVAIEVHTNIVAGLPLQLQAIVGRGIASVIFWDFGNGTTTSNQLSVTHGWSSPGFYTVTVTVSNNFVLEATSASLTINVMATQLVSYVNVNGTNPVPPYFSWDTAATKIQDALSVAQIGGIVLVTNGVYQSSGIPSPGITIGSSYYSVALTNTITLQSVNGPAVTYIEAPPYQNTFSGCVYMTNGVILSGFTLTTNGLPFAENYGVLAASANAIITNCIITGFSEGGVYSGTLYNCVLAGNVNPSYGGGATKSTMFNCIISNNAAANGGGVYGGTLNNCLIANNATYQNGAGGGVYSLQGYPAVLNNCIISNNTASLGGGVNNFARETFTFPNHLPSVSYTNCILYDCILTSNSASYLGGGAYCAQLNNCLISSNQVTGKQPGSFVPGGGGVESGSLNNCTLIGNSVTGAFEMEGGGAEGSVFPFNTVLSNCVLIANVAPQGGGANNCTLIQCTLLQNFVNAGMGTAGNVGGGAASCTLDNCLVISNSDSLAAHPSIYAGGGGVYACALTNCVLAYNVALTNGGGANNSILVNCAVIANTSTNGGGTLNCTNYNSILYYNTGGDYFPSALPYSLNYCCTALTPTNGFGNITNAPIFVNVAALDFHLQSTSPCINSGNNAYVKNITDLDGNPRIVGGTVDIGASEYQTPTSIISYAYLQRYGLPTDGSMDFADLNGTGLNVYQDWIAGLNPTNSASILAMIPTVSTNSASGITVTWQSVSGILYNLQRSTNLTAQPGFLTIQTNIVGQANTTSYQDTSATNNLPYFYRVGVP